MVLLAASICMKDGRPLLSRQFVEMTRSRIEALLMAFPKLVDSGKQHTFVETESVRYVYQPIEKLFVILLTTKSSNILEDLETLRLFARVIAEYSKGIQESHILKNAFEIIFAFDEIVALGYRESVNLAQIRTLTEMDSHEERIARATRENQEREARDIMKRKAKELQQQRREAAKRGGKSSYGFSPIGSSGIGASSVVTQPKEPQFESTGNDANNRLLSASIRKPAASASKKTLRLGLTNNQEADSFVNQLKAEGEDVVISKKVGIGDVDGGNVSSEQQLVKSISGNESVHCRVDEHMKVKMRRDGSLLSMELLGTLQVCVHDENFLQSRVRLNRSQFAKRDMQTQTHPNVDKNEFQQNNWIQSKPGKSYPLGQEVAVLRWRYRSQDEGNVPLMINCWPNERGGGNYEIVIEYELLGFPDAELGDVSVNIPLPHGGSNPVVNNCDGTYAVNVRKKNIMWNIPFVDKDNRTGSMDFIIQSANVEDFFPIEVSFNSNRSLLNVDVESVANSDGSPIAYSSNYKLTTDCYEIV